MSKARKWSDRDRAAFIAEVIDAYQTPLLRYAQGMIGDADHAQDVVQEAFCRLLTNPPHAAEAGVENNGQLASWLYTVCRNLAMDIARKDSRMTTLTVGLAESHMQPADSPHEAVEINEQADRVKAVINDLPKSQQEIVRLKFEHEMSYKQIAEITGKTVTNVGVTLHHAIKAIRKKLEG